MVVMVAAAGGALAVHEWGPRDGTPVVCVHGLSAHGLAFADLATRLADDGCRVIAMDLRGRGHAEITPLGTYGLQAHARDVESVADVLGLGPFTYVGWSMGALIGLLLARRSPSRLTSLILLDHAGAMDEAAVQAVRAGLARLDVVVPSREAYVEAARSASPIERWTDSWQQFFEYELGQLPDGRWSPTTDHQACLEDLAEADAFDWPALWSTLEMPSLLVRCGIDLGGGFVVPDVVRDAFAQTAPAGRVLEVASNHFDILTDRGMIDTVSELVSTTERSQEET